MQLDMMEQELIIEEAIEKHIEIINKKNVITETQPTRKDIDEIINKPKYKFDFKNVKSEKIQLTMDDGRVLTEGEIMSDRVKAVMINPPTSKDYERRAKIFEDTKIKSANMPVQKSDGWHKLRRGRVGGSECGILLNMNKHQAQYTFILDKVLGAEFKGNAATYHGNVFEDVVRMMYEYNNDVHSEEFSSLPHATNSILAASPDGIVSPYCRDMKTLTPLVGRMLEIKCPTMRKIKHEGPIKDTICPIYYWCQIQQQLECLDLDECDFIQCNIERYGGRNEWLEDTHPECDFRSLKYGNLRGIIIELIPSKLSECDYNEKGYLADMTVWTKTKCLFPPKIDMSLKELDDWILNELSNLPWGYTLYNIIYWRLVDQNCTLILRDKEWFQSKLPVYNKIWGYVEYLRANLDVCEKWKEWIDSQPRKYNDKIMTKLEMLVDAKKSGYDISNQKVYDNINDTAKSTKSTKGTKTTKGTKSTKTTKTTKTTKSTKTTKGTKITKLTKSCDDIKKGITVILDSDDDEENNDDKMK
jgi:putative phage-type endonuclease